MRLRVTCVSHKDEPPVQYGWPRSPRAGLKHHYQGGTEDWHPPPSGCESFLGRSLGGLRIWLGAGVEWAWERAVLSQPHPEA